LSADFLIIGAGVIGLSTAYELSLSGASVVVMDRGLAGRESSWAGAGILSALLPWDYPLSVNRLTSLGAELYPQWIAGLEQASGVSAEFEVCGMDVMPPFDSALALGWCTQNGMHAEITPENILRLPDVAQVRPPRLIAALKQTLLSRGVELLEGVEALQFEITSDTVTGVMTPNGTLRAREYVLTSGAFSHNLLINNNLLSGFRPVRGQMLLFKCQPGQLKTILYRSGKYVVPRRDGHILVGSTLEETGFDNRITEAGKRELQQAGLNLWPALAQAEFVSHWAGLRPGSPGNIPIIDRYPTLKNLYVNMGHFRYGLTMAPAAAKLMACRINGETPEIDPAPYVWPKEQK
jgi:glycine oxidase